MYHIVYYYVLLLKTRYAIEELYWDCGGLYNLKSTSKESINEYILLYTQLYALKGKHVVRKYYFQHFSQCKKNWVSTQDVIRDWVFLKLLRKY